VAEALDWAEFERVLHDELVRFVAAGVAGHPGERFYAAALDRIYAEEDGVVTIPALAMNSVSAVARQPAEDQAGVRWNPPDWELFDDDWLPDGSAGRWQAALTAAACSGSVRHWWVVFHRYRSMLVRVCRRARVTLRRSGITDSEFVVLLLDDDEALIRSALTPSEVARLFPELDARAAALATLTALPPAERATRLASLLGTFDGPISSEDADAALRHLGPPAFAALISLLGDPDLAWQAAKLLADIGRPDEAVISALRAALTRTGGSTQIWVAVALSRLGRLGLVLDRLDTLPPEAVVVAAVAPYTSFRDHAVDPPPLDYRPLAELLERWPAYVPDVERELGPGRGGREIAPGEVDAALGGLESPHAVIRLHAAGALGARRLGRAVGRRVLPRLARAVLEDPDPLVRRQAFLSLLWWGRDSRPFADAIRQALDDPAADVREAATQWLRSELAGPR